MATPGPRTVAPALLAALLLAGGCMPGPQPGHDRGPTADAEASDWSVATLTRADDGSGASSLLDGVRYDHATGTCSDGAVQVMEADAVDRMADGYRWRPGCSRIRLLRTPRTTAYPTALLEEGVAGSAQVLTIVDAGGLTTHASVVCTSDARLIPVAELAAFGIRYEPMVCDGRAVPGAALVPFGYDPD